MSILDWVPALSTTSLLGLALWLSRKVITTRLTNSVRHEYDEQIENLKTILRKSEENLKAEIRKKESEIEALRSGALSSIVNRQVALYEKQIIAVEQLWNSVIALGPAKTVSHTMASIKFDVASKRAASDPKVREMFNTVGGNFDLKNFKTPDASKTRPFISPLAWAFYSAYESIVMNAALKLQMLKSGLDMVEIINDDHFKNLIIAALPHHKDFIEEHGPSAYHHFLDELETSLLKELGKILRGDQSDKENVERAAKILEEVERLRTAGSSLNTMS
jgi:hypothetical protein